MTDKLDVTFDTDAEAAFQQFYDKEAEASSGAEGILAEAEVDPAIKDLSEHERECYDKGWRPEGELSAKAWSRQKDLINDVSISHKQLKQQTKLINKLNEEIKQLSDRFYSQDVKELENRKAHAAANGDNSAVAQYDKALAEAKPIKQPEQHPELADFLERNNDWWEGNSTTEVRMRVYAKQMENEFRISGKDLDSGLLQAVEEAVKEEFPKYFNRESAKESEEIKEKPVRRQAVESGTQITLAKSRNRAYTIGDLTADQKAVLEANEKAGLISPKSMFTREMYIQQLVDSGAVKK